MTPTLTERLARALFPVAWQFSPNHRRRTQAVERAATAATIIIRAIAEDGCERAAQATYAEMARIADLAEPWDQLPVELREAWRRAAMAGIAAAVGCNNVVYPVLTAPPHQGRRVS